MIYNICNICNENLIISTLNPEAFIGYNCKNCYYKLRFYKKSLEYNVISLKFNEMECIIYNYSGGFSAIYLPNNKELYVENLYIDTLEKLKLYLLFL